MDWILNRPIEKQFRSFKKGFDRVVFGDMIGLVSAAELHLIIRGSPHYNFFELEKETKYMDGFEKDSPSIK